MHAITHQPPIGSASDICAIQAAVVLGWLICSCCCFCGYNALGVVNSCSSSAGVAVAPQSSDSHWLSGTGSYVNSMGTGGTSAP